MVASGYDYRRDDDAGLWSSADLTYVITYEMWTICQHQILWHR
ncbi:hypothetical protein DMI70_14880 [Escherichia coli]|nr:hypothetical protein [Escherichia coli]